MVSVPAWPLVLDGVKETSIVQELPGMIVPLHAFSTLKPPLAVTDCIWAAALPTFVTVTICGPLAVPTSELKVSEEGVTLNCATGTAVPVPDRAMACGLFEALSTMLMVPVWPPTAVGTNPTINVQLAPGTMLGPQLFVEENPPDAPMD